MSYDSDDASHRPRKRFGQNFLHDVTVIERIVAAINPQVGEHLVEIGPGQGALTEPLLRVLGELDVVELDRDLIPPLQQHCATLGTLRVHAADALNFDFASLATDARPLRIVGNLPYNISTPLMFHLLDSSAPLRDMHFMLQKEVVARLAAAPGGKEYGRLSVMVQARCAVHQLFLVRPGAFWPVPRVDSAIVRLEPYAVSPYHILDSAALKFVVTRAFMQRRKTLSNALKDVVSAAEMASLGIAPIRRAETLSVAEFAALANLYVQRGDAL